MLMRRLLHAIAFLAAGALCLAAVPVRAQMKPINPNVPPPPPSSTSAPANSNAANNATSGNGTTNSGSTTAPPHQTGLDPTVPPPPPTEVDAEPEPEPEKVDQPVYDPLAAQKSLEIGQFYLKQGNLDAAIDRFNDAATKHPGYGRPFELLGIAYERKHDYANAIKAYQQCLHVYPHDPDRKKIEAKIAELQKKQQDDKEGK